MAAPQDAPEQGFRLRKFQGCQTEMDSTFIGPSFLVNSENWIPTQSYRLGKRPGSTQVQALAGITVSNLLAAHDPSGALYLYAYGYNASIGAVFEMIGEGAFTTNPPIPAAGSGWFTGNKVGRLIQFRNRVYAGNGHDPLVSWILGDNPNNTLQFKGIDDLGPAPAAQGTAPTNAIIVVPSGTYSYAWATFNTTTKLYQGRTQPGTVTIQQNQVLQFTAPAAPPAGQILRLFVSPRNYPIEYATMQLDNVVGASTVTVSLVDVTDTRVPQAGGINVFRTGNMFLVWNNRVVFAGMDRTDVDAQAPYSVFATDVILPGLEQAAFNQGTLFPDFAKVPLPAQVTGIGVAGVTAEYDAASPLLFFTLSKTFIVQGDPFDPAGQATMIELSSRVGCVAHDSIVNTPVGTIWCGLDSIYLITPGGGFPIDIGWPIANLIRSIPQAQRAGIVATFNKQFYKIAIPDISGTQNTTSWWLDLRGGVGQVPSWWGPMTGFALTALTGDPASQYEIDRCYGAIPGSSATWVMRLHQLTSYTDQLPDLDPATPVKPIRSRVQSGRFDADQPFLVKVFTRMRLISQTAGLTQLHVYLTTDGGVVWPTIEPIILGLDMELPGQFVHLVPSPPFPPPPSNPPNNKRFATGPNQPYAKFATISPAEAQTIMPYDRPRGLNVQIELVHDPTLDMHPTDDSSPLPPFFGQIELRDFELLFLESGRKVRFLNERISK